MATRAGSGQSPNHGFGWAYHCVQHLCHSGPTDTQV